MATIPTVSLSTTRGTQSPPILIRAPLSSDDNGSDAETLTSTDEGFETASDPGEFVFGEVRPIAQLTWDDDASEDDVFEDGLEDEIDGEGFLTIARVASVDQDGILGDESEVSDSEVYDPSSEYESGTTEMEKDEHLGSGSSEWIKGQENLEVEKDEARSISGSIENLEGEEGFIEKGPGADTVTLESTGAADGVDFNQNSEPVSVPAVETLELESSKSYIGVGGPEYVEGSCESFVAVNSESTVVSVAKPDDDEAIGFLDGGSASLDSEIAADSIHEIEAIDRNDSFNGLTESGQADAIGVLDGVSASVDSEIAEDSIHEIEAIDGNYSFNALTKSGQAEAIGFFDAGSASVDSEIDADSFHEIEAIDRNDPSKALTELGQSSIDLAAEPGLPLPEVAADGGYPVSFQEEVELVHISADESESRETEREITETSSMIWDGNSAVVSGETQDLESVSGPEEEAVADATELAADGGDSVSVQEVESPPVLAKVSECPEKEKEIIEDLENEEEEDLVSEGPVKTELAADGGDSVSVSGETQDFESVSGPEEEAVADATELAADGGDSVSVQEVESPPVLAKESECPEKEKEIIEDLENEEEDLVSEGPVKTEFAADGGDSVSVQEVESPPVLAKESECLEKEKEIIEETGKEEEEDLVSDGPAKVAILESHSGFGSLLNKKGEQIASDSDEDAMETDEEGDGKELFDSDALTAFLKAATGGSPDARILSVDRPRGLGSSIPSLKPAPPRSGQSNLRMPLDLPVASEPENAMDEEERKLHEKVDLIRAKFLLLVQRTGHSPQDTVATQVLYHLGLAEGIRLGRQATRIFSLDNARKKALELEMNGEVDLDFSCTILVLGKTGVGKSATVNSIFGKEKSYTNAFEQATDSVKEIVGIVDGVRIRVIDTPGLRASGMDQASNMKILSSVKRHIKRCPPDIVLYIDRMDAQTRDSNDLPLLRSITTALGPSIWLNAIVALTHAASAPPDGPNGYPLGYDVFVAQRSHVIQFSIRQAARDMRLMNSVTLVENHPSCRRNGKGERVLPNGVSWRPHMLLQCYSLKILSEANSLLRHQEPSPQKLFGFRLRSPPLSYFLSSLLQSRPHPKLSVEGESDVDLDDLLDAVHEGDDEEVYDELPPFKSLRKSEIAKLTKEQRRAYFDEYDYRVKLLQKKQWKEELRRLKEMKKRGKDVQDDFGHDRISDDFDQDVVPASVPVPLPDRVLPPSFDCDYPVYRYRSLEPTSQFLVNPDEDQLGWDHDCGYVGVNIEHNLAVVGCFPAGVSVQVRKDKKEFSMHLDSSISAKHGENGSTLAGFDIVSIGKQLAYILRSETKFKNLKKNKTGAGVSLTFLGETVAAGLKIDDQLSVGKRVSLGASTGAVRAQGDVAYGANLEASLRGKDYPLGQSVSTLVLSLLSWRGDLNLGANFHSQFSAGRNSKMAIRVGLTNKMSGQITIRTTSSEHLQIAIVGILPIAMSIYRNIWSGQSVPY